MPWARPLWIAALWALPVAAQAEPPPSNDASADRTLIVLAAPSAADR